jgi:hypothetical protein
VLSWFIGGEAEIDEEGKKRRDKRRETALTQRAQRDAEFAEKRGG